MVRLEYADGRRAELRYSWETRAIAKGLFQHSEILGKEGRITFESNGLYLLLHRRGTIRVFAPGVRDLMGYREMTRDFLECLDDRSRRPYSDFAKARRDLEVVFSAYETL